VVLKRLACALLGVVVFVSIATISPEFAAFAMVLGVFLVLPFFTYLDAINFPIESWNAAGRSRSGWTMSFFIFPFGVGMIAMAVYWTWVRRRLPGGTLRSGDQVEITAGLHAGQQATLARRVMLGLGGFWTATVLQQDGSVGEMQVSSSNVRRAASGGAGTMAGDEPALSARARQPGSIKVRLALLGLAATACGCSVVAIGFGVEGGSGGVVIALGVAAIMLGLFQVAHVMVRFRGRRRLPRSLRTHASSTEPVSIELRDGRRIVATGVLPGGYVLPRPTDPPYDAADVTAVVSATPDEIDEERHRQAGAS
jgi:hypothetical protein